MKNQAKRTPKPWRIEGQSIVGGGQNGYVCSWSGTISDAHLIASAPELLESLKEILSVVSVRIDDPRIEAFDKARKIIEKAEGK